MDNSGVRVKLKKFLYSSNIKLTGKTEGIIKSGNKSFIELSSPVEFGGRQDLWTPEDLLVASVNACLMTSFYYYAARRKFEFISYESFSEGTVELIDMRFVFTEIKIKPKIVIKSEGDAKLVENLLRISKNSCLITNSINAKIILEPQIQLFS